MSGFNILRQTKFPNECVENTEHMVNIFLVWRAGDS